MNPAPRFFGIFVLGAMLWVHDCSAEVFDYSVNPQSDDNFLEANFRLLMPDGRDRPDAIVVFIPGTDGDGRGGVTNPAFLSISKVCHAALLCCHYRGEGLNYDDPRGGSGRALDEALSHFADSTHDPELRTKPLLLLGYSQGGMFAFNYICLYPDRVRAFVALKAIFPEIAPQAKSFQVPGLLVAGQTDEPSRIRGIAKAFAEATGTQAKWAFLFEKEAGHELDQKSVELAELFFEAVCGSGSSGEPVLLNAETGASETIDSTGAGACWFPSNKVADTWKFLHQPAALHDLMSMPERPQLQAFLAVLPHPEKYDCKNGQQQSGTVDLTGNKPGMTIDSVQVAGDGFRIEGPQTGLLPMQITLLFAPRELPWGQIRADLEIGGSLNGQKLSPFKISIHGEVHGPIMAVPSMVYLGIVPQGGTVDKKVLLRTEQAPLHIAEIKAPANMSVTFEDENAGGPQLNIHWTAGQRLGRIYAQIQLALDSPEKGILRIPVLGIVSR